MSLTRFSLDLEENMIVLPKRQPLIDLTINLVEVETAEILVTKGNKHKKLLAGMTHDTFGDHQLNVLFSLNSVRRN